MDLAYDLSGELFVDCIVELCCFFLDEWEKVGAREVPLHFFELRNQPVSQFGRLFVQDLLLAVLTKYLYSGGLKDDVDILVPFGNFGIQDFLFVFEIAVNNWEGGVEVFLLVGNDVHNWVRVLKGPNQHLREEEDGVGQNGWVIAHEHHLLLQHQQG